MAFDLTSITSEARIRPPRIVVLGVEKIGKSEFAAGSGSPVFLPIKGEEGIDAIKAGKVPVCNTFPEVMGWLASLYTGTHNYETVVIDSASTLEPLIWADVCQRNGNVDSIEKVMGGYGKGYTEACKTWRFLTSALDSLRADRGMASILIGHVRVKRFDDPAGDSYDQYQFDIHDRAASVLYRWADVILFCNTKVVVRKEDVGFNKQKARGIEIAPGSRFLYTQKRPSHPGGGRGAFGHLPYELPLSWVNFQNAVATAVAAM